MREKLDLPAVRDPDLKKILDAYGLSEPLTKSKLKCRGCSRILSWENIGAIKVKENGLEIYCFDPECIEVAQEI